MGEFQCLIISLFKHKCVWANSWRGKTVIKCRRAKITWDENNTVYSIWIDWHHLLKIPTLKHQGLHLPMPRFDSTLIWKLFVYIIEFGYVVVLLPVRRLMDSSLNSDCCSNFFNNSPCFLHFPIQISWAKMLQICENP